MKEETKKRSTAQSEAFTEARKERAEKLQEQKIKKENEPTPTPKTKNLLIEVSEDNRRLYDRGVEKLQERYKEEKKTLGEDQAFEKFNKDKKQLVEGILKQDQATKSRRKEGAK